MISRHAHLVFAAELVPLMLVTGLEGVPVALAAAAPGIVAQRADEYGFPAQHHCHTLPANALLIESHVFVRVKRQSSKCTGGR